MILGEAGRGAYGMVKRAREFKVDGSLGVSFLTYLCIPNGLSALLAQCDYQANHQVSYLVRLLEEAPYSWHYPH
jgi:hypothetical protein